MPKYGRREFDERRHFMNPQSVIAFHCAKKMRENYPDAPPLRWCSIIGLFALVGQDRELHNFYGEFLKESFVRRKDWTIFALHWIRNYYDTPFLYAAKKHREKGVRVPDLTKPKQENHALLAALFAKRDNVKCLGLFKDVSDQYKNSKIDEKYWVDTAKIFEAAKKYGFYSDWTSDALSQAAKKYELLTAEYSSYDWRIFEKDAGGFF
jgi:hypothetical protein